MVGYHVMICSDVKGKALYFLGGWTVGCEWSASLHTQATSAFMEKATITHCVGGYMCQDFNSEHFFGWSVPGYNLASLNLKWSICFWSVEPISTSYLNHWIMSADIVYCLQALTILQKTLSRIGMHELSFIFYFSVTST